MSRRIYIHPARTAFLLSLLLGIPLSSLCETNGPGAAASAQLSEPEAVTPPTADANPFRIIPARNAFGIKDPPPPPPPVQEAPPPPPPPPPANVTLTGFSLWKGRKKVYLQVSSPGSKSPVYRDLEEGAEQDEIKILSIDEKNETVRILNAGQEFTLNFKENGAKPQPGAGGAPGAPGTIPVPATSALTTVNPNVGGRSGPVVIGRGGVTDAGGGVGAQAAMDVSAGASGLTSGGMGNAQARQDRALNNPQNPGGSGVIAVPGQDRVVGGVRIPAPPPLPVPDLPLPGNQ